MLYAIIEKSFVAVGGVCMRLESSYIFLPNPYNKKPSQWEDQEGVLHVEIGDSIHSYIEETFSDIKTQKSDDFYFQYEYSFPVEIGGQSVDVSIISKTVLESYYLNVAAEGKSKIQLIGALEYVDSVLSATEVEKNYIPIVSYDAVSEYYCNKLYPKLNKLERNLRKLLFNIYVLNFGKEYFQATTPQDMQDKAKKIMQTEDRKRNTEEKEIQYIKRFFYSLEYADIQQLLFVPRWTKVDEKSKKDFLDTYEDLSKLSDEELRTTINSISPKSDWERFFEGKVKRANIEGDIEKVRRIRNKVAHSKLLGKAEYIDCNKTINDLNRALTKAITITEEKDFVDKSAEHLRKALASFSTEMDRSLERLREQIWLSTKRWHDILTISNPLQERFKGLFGTVSQMAGQLKNITMLTDFDDANESRIIEEIEEGGESEDNEDA